jgi:hypothetical protein
MERAHCVRLPTELACFESELASTLLRCSTSPAAALSQASVAERPVALPPEEREPAMSDPSPQLFSRLLPSSAVRKLPIDEDLLLIGSILALAAVALLLFWILF